MLSIKILAKSLHLYFYPSIFPIIVLWKKKLYLSYSKDFYYQKL